MIEKKNVFTYDSYLFTLSQQKNILHLMLYVFSLLMFIYY